MKKYRYVLNSISTNYQITIIKDDRLEYLVKSSEAVFGCNSMALVVALKLKIKTYNCIFYKNMVSMLPYNNINVLNEKIRISTGIIGLGKIGLLYDLNKKKF